MTFKRPRLSLGGEGARGGARETLHIPARCQIGERWAEEAWVTDLGRESCELQLVTVGVTKAERVALHIGGEEPISGRPKRVRQGSLEIAFDAPLEDALLARLLAIEPPANVVVLRRGSPR